MINKPTLQNVTQNHSQYYVPDLESQNRKKQETKQKGQEVPKDKKEKKELELVKYNYITLD